MDQKWIGVVLVLLFCHEATAGEAMTPAEGQKVDIQCEPVPGSVVIWFRVLDKSGVEFIASFGSTGMIKSEGKNYTKLFSHSKTANQYKLTLKSYKKGEDSGIYSCGSLYKGTELKFGKVTRLVEETPKPPIDPPPAPATTPSVVTTTPCVCKNKKDSSNPSLSCDPLILGSLAGGCGLLLLLLIVTILYCNRIRTRRCPHHYKRRLQVAPEKQMMTNRCT